jgi:hypothetical protein
MVNICALLALTRVPAGRLEASDERMQVHPEPVLMGDGAVGHTGRTDERVALRGGVDGSLEIARIAPDVDRGAAEVVGRPVLTGFGLVAGTASGTACCLLGIWARTPEGVAARAAVAVRNSRRVSIE